MTAPASGASAESESRLYTVTYIEVAPGLISAARSVLTSAIGSATPAVDIELLQRLGRVNQLAILASAPRPSSRHSKEDGPDPIDVAAVDAALASMLIAPTDTRRHTLLARGGLHAGSAADGQGDPTIAEGQSSASSAANGTPVGQETIVVVTHVDVVPQYRDDGAAALRDLASASASHDGCARFEVWQQTNRPNHFTVIEAWAGSAAFEAHIAAAETRAFRAALAPMSGALYDERLYQSLQA